jgi:hypothetical protein
MTTTNDYLIAARALRLDADWDESAHPRAENGQFGEGTGVVKDKYGNTVTAEKLNAPADFMSKGGPAALHLNPDHDEGYVIISHNGSHIGALEHKEGKWQERGYRSSIKQEYVDAMNRAAPRGMRDIDPSEYNDKGERKGQQGLF